MAVQRREIYRTSARIAGAVVTKQALILGVTGQDGSYLADILLERGYEVHGMYRHSSTGNLSRIQHNLERKNPLVLHKGDMTDVHSLWRILDEVNPCEMYNEADQDNVNWSFATPSLNYDLTFTAVGNLLELIKEMGMPVRIFQPCSATVFGNPTEAPQTEATPFNPRSPYACAKAGVYHLCRYYREVHGMHVTTGILYNHDSPRRSEDYLLSKICRSIARIAKDKQPTMSIGRLEQVVSLSSARDCMEGAVGLLQLSESSDYLMGGEQSYTIGQLVELAAAVAGLEHWNRYVLLDPRYATAELTPPLVPDCTKMRDTIGWRVSHISSLIKEIVTDELRKCT